MATWQDNGEVPASDDEDVWDSQSTDNGGACDDHELGWKASQITPLQHTTLSSELLSITDPREESPDPLNPLLLFQLSKRSVEEGSAAHEHAGNLATRPITPPSLSQRSKRDEFSVCSPENDLPALGDISPGKEVNEVAPEEISKSYIALSSPASTLSLSPPPTIIEDPFSEEANFVKELQADGFDLSTLTGDNGLGIHRRNLRQRAPIQMHPFLLEAENYRRTFQSRGLKPVRVQSTQEPRQAADSQNEEYEIGDVQMPDSEDNDPQSSSQIDREANEASNNIVDGAASSTTPPMDIDDLPDIGQLVNAHDIPDHNILERRKSQYGNKRRLFPHAAHRQLERDIWNVPDSPPLSSSPRPRAGGDTDDATPLTAHYVPASLDSDSSPLTAFRRPLGLSTPRPSASKVSINLNGAQANAQANFEEDSSDSGSDTDSSSEESSQLRRYGRKMKGVLPASWCVVTGNAKQTVRPRFPPVAVRESATASPERSAARRGVAVPKLSNGTAGHSPSSLKARTFLLPFDESEDEDLPEVSDPHRDTLSVTTGLAVEDDRIDAMLPSRKRQAKLVAGTKRRRLGKAKPIFREERSGQLRQPKIYDIDSHRGYEDTDAVSGIHRGAAIRPRSKHARSKHPRAQVKPPRLSIVDTIDLGPAKHPSVPAFVRIAARNARGRADLGRHSPSRKFIRLDTREDTIDAQERLIAWRQGTIQPQQLAKPSARQAYAPRQPLREVSNNSRVNVAKWATGQLDAPIDHRTKPSIPPSMIGGMPSTQTTMSVDLGPQIHGKPAQLISNNSTQTPTAAVVRPAQLETTAEDFIHAYPDVAFRSNKKALDVVYKHARKDPAVNQDLRLNRFLYDDDPLFHVAAVLPTIEVETVEVDDQASDLIAQEQIYVRRKKRNPQRLDIGAAKYRQPVNLITQFLKQTPKVNEIASSDGKLYGLASYGISYTFDFDMIRLPTGVFFHESTFIGSGQLDSILQSLPINSTGVLREAFQLGDKVLQWSAWDETVSGELGICFDWLADRLATTTLPGADDNFDRMLECIMFVIRYLHNLFDSFSKPDKEALLHRLSSLLNNVAASACRHFGDVESQATLGRLAEIGSRLLCLAFQAQDLARRDVQDAELVSDFEATFRLCANLTIKVLLSADLDGLRELYEDLQYLTCRETGIRPTQYAAQAWLTVAHILERAKVAGALFWDIFNAQLLDRHTDAMHDAKHLEQMWYSMSTLLPLLYVGPDGRLLRDYSCVGANWSLVVKLSDPVFTLYKSRQRQSAGFNDYCRALYSRAYHLLDYWGWRNQAAIIGPFFDFFASQGLVYLRNEPPVGSPHFLQNLNQQPSLAPEPRDVCFHILLKIIALSYKQMTANNEIKKMRNLVPRLLPNHDRQYPKDQPILESDLASLRNHHDLLCTLFWVIPAGIRPSISRIRQLVDPEGSHKAAYLISLRAWTNVARFVLAIPCAPENNAWPNPPPMSDKAQAWEPFAEWQAQSFVQLLDLYHSAGKIVGHQLSHLSESARLEMSQGLIDGTIQANRLETMDSLTKNLWALKDLVADTSSMDVARLIVQNKHCEGKPSKHTLSLVI